MFEERNQALQYVCETPVMLEQRLFEIGRRSERLTSGAARRSGRLKLLGRGLRDRASAGATRTAQNLYSGILPNGSSAGLVRRFAAASA